MPDAAPDLANQPLQAFLDELASAAPAPGGGAAAALGAALGAALVSMVCRLSAPKSASTNTEVAADDTRSATLSAAEALRQSSLELAADDANAYLAVHAAYGQPKQTEAEQAARTDAIQQALLRAAEVPLATVHAAAQVARLADELAELANRNVISDIGVAVHLARAGADTAALNVKVNTRFLLDREEATRLDTEVAGLLAEMRLGVDRALAVVERVMGE